MIAEQLQLLAPAGTSFWPAIKTSPTLKWLRGAGGTGGIVLVVVLVVVVVSGEGAIVANI